jgi:hypothetical protein
MQLTLPYCFRCFCRGKVVWCVCTPKISFYMKKRASFYNYQWKLDLFTELTKNMNDFNTLQDETGVGCA